MEKNAVTKITAFDFLVGHSLQCISLGLNFYAGSRALIPKTFLMKPSLMVVFVLSKLQFFTVGYQNQCIYMTLFNMSD